MECSIKVIFFDIDGTLLSLNNHKMPTSTIKALNELRNKGIKLFVATGRHKSETRILDDYFKFDGHITLNGQYCFNEDKVIYKNCIDKKEIEKIVDQTRKDLYSCFFITEDGLFVDKINEDVKRLCEDVNLNVPKEYKSSYALDEDIYQLLILLSKDNEHILLKDKLNLDITRWHDDFIDVMPKGGNKCIGIKEILKHYNISKEEIMSFGDGENDIDMLMFSNIGVAMGNASDKVKLFSDYVTDTVDNDGIMRALKYYKII